MFMTSGLKAYGHLSLVDPYQLIKMLLIKMYEVLTMVSLEAKDSLEVFRRKGILYHFWVASRSLL